MKQIEQRTEAARAVPKTEFDIDFHLYRKTGRDFEMSISIEKTYESFQWLRIRLDAGDAQIWGGFPEGVPVLWSFAGGYQAAYETV